MVVGCLGDIPFLASEEAVRTVENMTWSGSARYSVHNRHLDDALTEFEGRDPDQITFDITLSADLGVDPMEEISRLFEYERSGETLPLVLGEHFYGKYRWSLIKHSAALKTFYINGDVHTAVVSVSLQEYLRR